MSKATKAKLLSFSMKDRAGLLSEITTPLANAKVNVTGICAYAMDGTAYIDVATENNVKAKKALAGLGVKIEEEDIIFVELPNKTGELQKVAGILADAGINIIYMYGTASSGKTSTCLFSTSNNKKALKIIK